MVVTTTSMVVVVRMYLLLFLGWGAMMYGRGGSFIVAGRIHEVQHLDPGFNHVHTSLAWEYVEITSPPPQKKDATFFFGHATNPPGRPPRGADPLPRGLHDP